MTRSRSPEIVSKVESHKLTKKEIEILTLDEITDYFLEEMELVLDEEYEKELAKLPKVEPPKEPTTQKEKCAVGRHARIVDGKYGDICSACGFMTSYYFNG